MQLNVKCGAGETTEQAQARGRQVMMALDQHTNGQWAEDDGGISDPLWSEALGRAAQERLATDPTFDAAAVPAWLASKLAEYNAVANAISAADEVQPCPELAAAFPARG